MTKSRFAPDELYRLVFEQEGLFDEPDWDELNTHYANRLGYILIKYVAVPVHPYSEIKFYMEPYANQIWVSKVWPRDGDTQEISSNGFPYCE